MNKNQPSLRYQIFLTSLWNISAGIVARLGGLLFTIIIARYLLPESFGIYSLAFSVTLFCITFADLGINQALIIYVSGALHTKKKARAYYSFLLRLKLYLTLGTSCLLALLAYPLANIVFDKPLLTFPLILCAIYIFFASIESFYESLFYVGNKVKYVGVKETIFQLTRITLGFLVLTSVAISQQINALFFVLVITMIVTFAYVFVQTKKIRASIFNEKQIDTIDMREIFKFIFYTSLGITASAFFVSIDVIMLGIYVPAAYIGYYKAAFAIIAGITGLLSFYNIFLPVFAKYKGEKLKKILNSFWYYLSILSLPATGGIIILGGYFIRAIYGPAYLPSKWIIVILAPLIFIEISAALISAIFASQKKPQYLVKTVIFTLLLNIILNIIFLEIFAIQSPLKATLAVAISTVISRFIYLLALIFLLRRVIYTSLSIKPILKLLIATSVMMLSVFLTLQVFNDINLISGIMLVVEGILIYSILFLLLTGFSLPEYGYIYNIIRQRAPFLIRFIPASFASTPL